MRRVAVRPLLLWCFLSAGLAAFGCKSEAEPGVVSIEKTPYYQDATLLAQAWQLPAAASYRKAGFASQENGSLCGMTSTVNVMKSLGQTAPSQKSLIIGVVSPFLGVELMGVTLDELESIMRTQTKRKVTKLRGLSLAQFREHVQQANDPSLRYVVNFTRKPLFARGGGHFSPLGGYLADRDLVFVLDVNAEYKPFLVSTERLFAAVDTLDSSSEAKRGLLRIE